MNAITTERRIAIVSPFYNEGENVRPFIARLTRALSDARIDWQLICVNDGSSDDTLARLIAARAAEPRIAIIDLSRNFGKEYALTAGLDHADAAAVVLMDSDLQHTPEVIPHMAEKWLEGYEVVYMARRRRSDIGVVKRAARRLFYFAFRTVSQVSLPPDAGDFRLLDASVVAAIREMPEQTRFMKGIYQGHKLFRRAETGGRREITCPLVSPTTVKRVLHHRHEFHVRKTHLFYVGH